MLKSKISTLSKDLTTSFGINLSLKGFLAEGTIEEAHGTIEKDEVRFEFIMTPDEIEICETVIDNQVAYAEICLLDQSNYEINSLASTINQIFEDRLASIEAENEYLETFRKE